MQQPVQHGFSFPVGSAYSRRSVQPVDTGTDLPESCCRRKSIHFGSFTVPMSLHWRWWVQPSEMRMRLPSGSVCSVCAACIAGARTPLSLANRMENEVSRISSGTMERTVPNTWLSVTTRRGGSFNRERVRRSCSGWVTTQIAVWSNISRIACTWGRIIRPFGADSSMGVTRSTTSSGCSRLPNRRTDCRAMGSF